ncbi:DUF7529 family protein [Natronomonas marina]|jgi:hypothetical protein|uniref:DUF7529 family protein n=1 Tax=Natronomonas marina TaxID=2961939 RepID=UPI0020C9F2C7|nr:hypothetical protein [Natronomonas marina]
MSFEQDNDDDRKGMTPTSDAEREAWELTHEDMEAIAAERREEGWEVTTATALHTNPVGRNTGEDPERFGIEYIVADNHADDLRAAYERADGEFPEFVVYRREVGPSVFIVVELMDPDTETEIVVAGHYDGRRAGGLANAAIETGEMYSYAKTLDGTELGSFYHEEYEPFFPDVEAADGDDPA